MNTPTQTNPINAVDDPSRNLDGTLKKGHSVGASTRFQPGRSGNPQGRPSGGASVKEWVNIMQNYTRPMILTVTQDADAPSNKVAAATLWLEAIRPRADIADFEDYLNGDVTSLESLKKMGHDITQIKKARRRMNRARGTRTVELEFMDPDFHALDSIMDRTHGRPAQTAKATQSTEPNTAEVLDTAAGLLGAAMPPSNNATADETD